MGHAPGPDLPAAQSVLLQRAVDHFQDDRRVMGLVLGGSLAHGVADSYSDAVFEERAAVALALGSPLVSFAIDPIPGGSRDYTLPIRGPSRST